MSKKLISVLLCLTILGAMVTTLSGCGKNGGSSDTLVWYMVGDKPADLENVLAEANKIVEEKIGMKLDMQYIDSASYAEKMKLKMAAGEAYDLAFTGYVNDYQTAVTMGGLYDITELIDKVGLKDVIPEFYLDSAMVDGKIYGIPNIQVASNPVCIYMDKKIADELNIDMAAIQTAAQKSKNIDDLKAYAALLDDAFAKIHEAKPEMYVFNPSYNLFTSIIFENILGDTFIRKDGSSDVLEYIYDTEEWKFSAQKIREWYQKGYIRNDIASKGTSLTTEEKKMVVVKAGTWKPGQDSIVMKDEGIEPVYALLHKPYIARTNPLATMISVGANTKNPEKAVEFLKLINTDKDLYNIICWGIEGTHYTKNEEGKIKEIAGSGYENVGKSAWKYGNQFNSLLLEEQDDNVWKETEEMNNNAVKSPLLGFVPNTENITNELANLTNVGGEYTAKRSYGTEDFDAYYGEFRQKLEQAGSAKVLAELQMQYNEFLASKN